MFSKLMLRLAAALLAVLALPATAALNVFATVPEWAALAKEIGGDRVQAFAATNALQDPHRIEAKPSLIAKARGSQLVVATGADLEIGWLPVVLREAGNAAIQPGQPGYFEAASAVRLIEVPTRLDRADGDVHPAGNPHIQTDPRNLLKVAEALAGRMARVDPAGASIYEANLARFREHWQANLARWTRAAAPLRGVPVWVQHRSFAYMADWLGLKELGALEPKPGVEPGSAHLASLLARQKETPARMILRTAYARPTASEWLGERAGIPVVVLPFTVGGNPAAGDLTALFDDTVQRLLGGLR